MLRSKNGQKWNQKSPTLFNLFSLWLFLSGCNDLLLFLRCSVTSSSSDSLSDSSSPYKICSQLVLLEIFQSMNQSYDVNGSQQLMAFSGSQVCILIRGSALTLRIKLLMAELKSLGMASRVRKPSNLSYCLPAPKSAENLYSTTPSPFITINNEEVIFYISPNADTDTVELIIKRGKMSMVAFK